MMCPLKERSAKLLFELRKASNLSQIEMSKRLEVSQGTLSKLERGLSSPGLSILHLLYSEFDCNIIEIIGKEGKEQINCM